MIRFFLYSRIFSENNGFWVGSNSSSKKKNAETKTKKHTEKKEREQKMKLLFKRLISSLRDCIETERMKRKPKE